jgi:tRNA-2-methylthio-N6-dimethylallyladenosine synthase
VHFTLPDGVKAPRPGDIVTVTVSEAGPYHLIADPKTSAEITVRRTIGGDAFERLNEGAETKRIALSITPTK